MLEVKVEHNAIQIGDRFSVSFQRTLRIPDDGKTYPLPPGLGEFPICKVDDYADSDYNRSLENLFKHSSQF